jgi:hypothetical protein
MRLALELIPSILALTIIHLIDYLGHAIEQRKHRKRDEQFGEQHFTPRKANR